MEASDIIKKNKHRIIENWLNRLRQEFPEVKNYPKSAIENDVPDLLEKLADSLEVDNTGELQQIGKKHGQQRTNFAHYTLGHVIKEYHLLKVVLFEELDRRKLVSNDERNQLLHVIDKAIEQSAETFFRLQKKNILAAKEEAEKSVEKLRNDDILRDDFISAVSHDLNNPINNIKLVVELWENDKDQLNNDKLLNIVRHSTLKAEKLIKDLLDVNLINSGAKLPLHIKDCDLLSSIKESVEEYQLTLGAERIQLEATEDSLPASADCEAIIRALDNLIDNAAKYGDQQKPVIVECGKTDHNIYISVFNYGNPIPLKDQVNIFNRFYRIDSDLSKNIRNKGWGIGLSLVKGITEAHGGKVTVDSNGTAGTKFTMIIPEE